MNAFPATLLQPKLGSLQGDAADASIEIPLEPFALDDMEVATTIRLDCVLLPTINLSQLSGQEITYPVNPADDAIDGSIYIEHAHHPFDVTKLSFGTLKGGRLPVEIQAKILFEFEGLRDYSDVEVTLIVELELGVR